ncbi:MAG TPA: hypothetical protein VN615_10495 [Gaiellales bacterium]|nr:hypothetical protein [Gaiellales bacterium]
MLGSAQRPATWERWAWMAGIVFVLALLAESVVATGIGLTHQESAATIARGLHAHEQRMIAIACISIVYAVAFVVYLWKLYLLLRGDPARPNDLGILVLVGGVLFVTLHAVSDIGITGMLGARVASYSAAHDQGLSFSLYYLTYALDSVADVFGSLAFLAAGLSILRAGELPRRLGWVAIATAPFLLLQGFGLGGVIATFGLALDLVGFLLLLVFVVWTSVAGYRLTSSR